MYTLEQAQIGIIGLGYVGLPLAVEFGKKFPTVGFDINPSRLSELNSGTDSTLEVSDEELTSAIHLNCTSDLDTLKTANVYIVTVPTPIDSSKRPDFRPLIGASHTIGKVLSRGNIVIYESTVYPGATEEICVPILEKESGLCFNKDFFCGYSPERINPGDKNHRLPNIVKVTSGSTPEVAEFIDSLYRTIITAGTFKVSSIKVAEAAKVIENTQRDVNIALINELSLIFNKLGINTIEVLEAAGTKWNFLPFRPGLVGGHCIGVDPYYLTHKAQEVGYQPDMILAGRRLNDNMGSYIASQMIKLMVKKGIDVANAKILIMGLTFKENCPDLRNTKVIDIIGELKEFCINTCIYDPWVNQEEALKEYGIPVIDQPSGQYDGIIFTVAHRQFQKMTRENIQNLCKSNSVLYDVKNMFPADWVDGSL